MTAGFRWTSALSPGCPRRRAQHVDVAGVAEDCRRLVDRDPPRVVDLVLEGELPSDDPHLPVPHPLRPLLWVRVVRRRQLAPEGAATGRSPPPPRARRSPRRSRPAPPSPSGSSSRRSGAGGRGARSTPAPSPRRTTPPAARTTRSAGRPSRRGVELPPQRRPVAPRVGHAVALELHEPPRGESRTRT